MRFFLRPAFYLYKMMNNIHMSKEKLKAYQNQELKKIINYSYEKVPYYNRLFKNNGISPSDINTISDLNKLPIISKDEMRNNTDDLISNEYNKNSLIRYSTSGSTGKPLPIYINKQEDDYRKAKHLRSNIVVGQKPWDKYVCITTPSHFGEIPTVLRKLGIFSREYISVFDDIGTQIKQISEIKPEFLTGYSSSLHVLARGAEERDVQSIRPKVILGGAELSDETTRKYIEGVFKAPFIDQYAIVELEKISWQCLERKEYHLDADSVLVQFVDKNGDEVSEGERGEIVCTSLFNYAMPFLRYKVGDIGIPSGNDCDCGITFPTMKMIEGRKDSMLLLPGNQIVSPRTFNIAMNYFENIKDIDQFKVIQKRIDHFEIIVKIKDEIEDRFEERLLSHMYNTLNINEDEVSFEVKIVSEIPKDKTGKFRAIISEIS